MSAPDDEEIAFCRCGEDGCPECDGVCWYCQGDGWGVVGEDFPERFGWTHVGDVIECPNCGGSGRAKDCTFW